MATVAIIGKIDIDNYGDLLLARIFVERLHKSGVRVTCSGISPSIAKQIHVDGVEDIQHCDAILYIGGGYFGEQPGRLRGRLRWGTEKLLHTIMPGLHAIAKRKPVAIIGPGYGPITNIATRLASLLLFRGARLISLRDQESVSFYKKYGGRCKVIETADCALTMAELPLQKEGEVSLSHWRELKGSKKLIGVHVTKQTVEHKGGDYIFSEIDRLSKKPEFQLVFFNDQQGTSGGKQTIEYYKERFGKDSTTLQYTGIDQLTGFLQACDLVITTKLHVGIVATARRTPVLSFPYHTKTLRYYKQIGRADLCLPFTEWTEANIARQFGRASELVNAEVELPEQLLQLAKLNMKLVDSFVTDHVSGLAKYKTEEDTQRERQSQ